MTQETYQDFIEWGVRTGEPDQMIERYVQDAYDVEDTPFYNETLSDRIKDYKEYKKQVAH